jgi:predicted ArsR family transcriptional regulator
MSEKKAFEALSSASRLKILSLLRKKPLCVEEIAELVNLKPITIRHHLQSLKNAGFIESYEKHGGVVGRPKVYYKISKEPKFVTYPRRRYLTLAALIMKTLPLFIGSKQTGKLLEKIGKNMGESTLEDIGKKHNIKDWSFEDFKELFINRYLKEDGAEPEIVKADETSVVFRTHNCLFLELAVNMPEIMCDVLHESFDKGISNALGGKAKIRRLTCQGHGDPYCEHECIWNGS